MQKKQISWGRVIFWLLLLWPVGIFLLFKKASTDKSILMSGKTGAISAVGWFFVIAGGYIIMKSENLSEKYPSLVLIALAMFIAGIMVLRKASKIKRAAVRYNLYTQLVVNQNVRSIDSIVNSVGFRYNTVVKDLQNMINTSCLEDAYLNQEKREIVLAWSTPISDTPTSVISDTQTSVQDRARMRRIAVKCSGCGANNVVAVGSVSECEYCGTPISG
ncbi:hypothetical protein [Scatolibacter rhodanostii]|uniref:hypothetical protein n=1 Tax=Scatolibacter rhodanostii TaxID=2014781 RepID=UPI000C082E3D|nr:hypothetical protein [Scatolibacter rhodanostii]